MLKVYDLLLVDDEELICKGLMSMIQRLDNKEVRSLEYTTDSLEALEIIEKQKPDIVITDIKMPNISGLDLIERSSRDILYIVLSGYDDFHYVKEAYNLGIVDYMLKPVIIDELRLVLEKANSMLKKKAHNKVIQRSQASILIKTILENKLNKLITADETSKPDTMELFSELKVYFPHQFFAVAIVSEVRSCSSEFEKTKQNERLVTALVEIYRTTDVILHGIVNSKDQLVLVFNLDRKSTRLNSSHH